MHYSEYGIGIVEQHGYCDSCGYIVEQAYSKPIEGFLPPIRRGGKDDQCIYHPKNWRKRKRMKRKFQIKYKNEDRMLAYI